jgi:hypothetical protein
MAMSVGLVMPIPAATNAPSPPAMEELLKFGSMSVVVFSLRTAGGVDT